MTRRYLSLAIAARDPITTEGRASRSSKRTRGLAAAAMLAFGGVCGATISGTAGAGGPIQDTGILAEVPGIAMPSGYANYCSVTDPTNGGWALLAPETGDSCAELSAKVGPHAIVRHAGLWATHGNNNVMVRCDRGVLYYGRTYGAGAIDWIFHRVTKAQKNCVFTISPTQLAAFGYPFSPSAEIFSASVFGYHLQGPGWDIKEFGRTGGDGNACQIDRTGFEVTSCTGGTPVQPNPPHSAVFEPAYDWGMALDTPVLAVANGIIRGSQQRVVAPMCPTGQSIPGSKQLELFLETQIGSGQYAEHFVAAYHHMNANPNAPANVAKWGGPMAPVGTVVKKGDVIGYIGSTGCSGSNHVDFMVFRLTNLTGGRSYTFQPMMTTFDAQNHATNGVAGVNGWQGLMDPFGWAAPQGIDPLAYKFIGLAGMYNQPLSISDMGTFSVALWDFNVDLVKNGGPAW